jgi:hypothetical protein
MLQEYVAYCTEYEECSAARHEEVAHAPDGPLAIAIAALSGDGSAPGVPVDVLLRAPVGHLSELTGTVEALSAAGGSGERAMRVCA